jgi:hypothetical protein
MKKQTVFIIAFSVLVLGIPLLHAEIPQYINYQGRLTDDTGNPLEDGDYSIIFAIWDEETEGDQLWANDFGVTVVNGFFAVSLGPLEENIFSTGANRWLSIDINGLGELEPRTQLLSAPYAYHALTADTAYHIVGAQDCGWQRDSRGVTLKTPGDSVGIGTSAPSAKLDVEGSIKTSDTLIANHARIGSLSESGKIRMYGEGSANPYAALAEFWNLDGGALYLFQNDPYTSAINLEPDADGSGGFLTLYRSDYDIGFYVDGNKGSSNEPYVAILGSERSATFDMSVAGDSSVELPYSSISSSEMWNEAGVANSVLSSSVSLGNTPTTILTRRMWFPSAGYAVVIGTARYAFGHDSGTLDQLRFGISMTEGTLPVDQFNYRDYPGIWASANFKDFITVHDYYSVAKGENIFYLLGEHLGSSPSALINDANLTVMFFPTWRGQIIIPKADESNPEQYEIDQMITDRIEEEKHALRQEFEAKLEQIKAELKKQKGE